MILRSAAAERQSSCQGKPVQACASVPLPLAVALGQVLRTGAAEAEEAEAEEEVLPYVRKVDSC